MPKQIMLQLPAPHPALSPIRHRSEQAQADLIMVRARAVLVEARTALINAARGLTKSYGERLPSCGTNQMGRDVAESLSPALRTALDPLLEQVEEITERIREYDRMLGQLAKERYPEVDLLTQVHGVGILIALTFVLTVEDPHRFRRSRDVSCYVGLRPKRRQSGQSRQRKSQRCAVTQIPRVGTSQAAAIPAPSAAL
jgi:transposase